MAISIVVTVAAVAVMKAAVGLGVPGVEMAGAAEIVLVVMVVPMTTAYRAALGTCTLGSGPSHSDTDRVAASFFAGKNTV